MRQNGLIPTFAQLKLLSLQLPHPLKVLSRSQDLTNLPKGWKTFLLELTCHQTNYTLNTRVLRVVFIYHFSLGARKAPKMIKIVSLKQRRETSIHLKEAVSPPSFRAGCFFRSPCWTMSFYPWEMRSEPLRKQLRNHCTFSTIFLEK